MSINGNADLVDRIRAEYAKADAKGHDRPGRPALINLLANPPEISGHQVRKAKELVDTEYPSPPPAATSDTPTASPEPPTRPAPHAAGDSRDPDTTSQAPARHQPSHQDTSRPLVLWPLNTAHRLAAVTKRMTETLEAAETPAPASDAPPAATSRAPRPWPLVLIGLAAAVAVWSGWVGLGEMAGFGLINVLPGIADGWTINSAIVLPISVEAYAAYALRVWLSTSRHSARTIQFAKVSTIASLAIGGAAQVAYHLMVASGFVHAPWWVVMLVAVVPVAVLGLASALAKLVASDRQAGGQW